ncbi:biotin transporter BioY [Thermococcus thioreducens]|uniref:Biotin transport system substrate-specific component n=1 Tax=Thermococcus thioreducens TaxID=277988 RepID=A0A0Q2M308_9EURY|nr:biotin transporter BioY [Thermococcus thioreducens]ASJ12829.1 biotin transporter BioY [Thermococcus thioreducens]KQH82298.1 biotin transporter BioY [Thermococcus thioreducens]SEV84633.1 biotin transport system substrate-specific component [Thermococcus thioreducens]
MRARDVAFAGLFAALTAVGAQISIPVGPVPVTLQVFLVLLSGLVLGARLGFLSQLVYVLMGAVGIPVFANFQGGFAVLYGPTGGYIAAFPIAAFLTGYITEKSGRKTGMVLGSLAGVGAIYLLGWLRLGLFLAGDFHKAFLLGVLPFIPVDVIKAALAVLIADRVRKAMDLG